MKTWGASKTIQASLIGFCAMTIAITICAFVIPNEPIQIKENEK